MSQSYSVFCGQCGYDLRGSPEQGACSECGAQYDQEELRRDQGRSFPRMTLALKFLAVFVVLVVLNALAWIIVEDFVRIRAPGRLELIMVLIGIPGTLLLWVIWAFLLLRLERATSIRERRFPGNLVQWRLLPQQVRFWITFNGIGLVLAGFVGVCNPIWKILLMSIRRLV